MKKAPPVRIVIPDAGVLISLAHGRLLDVLFSFSEDVRLSVTDVVHHEATLRTDLVDPGRIREFLKQHAARITVDATGFHQRLEQARHNPAIVLPKNIGEISIYGYINDIRQDESGMPAQRRGGGRTAAAQRRCRPLQRCYNRHAVRLLVLPLLHRRFFTQELP